MNPGYSLKFCYFPATFFAFLILWVPTIREQKHRRNDNVVCPSNEMQAIQGSLLALTSLNHDQTMIWTRNFVHLRGPLGFCGDGRLLSRELRSTVKFLGKQGSKQGCQRWKFQGLGVSES